jgi:hypothetical protein
MFSIHSSVQACWKCTPRNAEIFCGHSSCSWLSCQTTKMGGTLTFDKSKFMGHDSGFPLEHHQSEFIAEHSVLVVWGFKGLFALVESFCVLFFAYSSCLLAWLLHSSQSRCNRDLYQSHDSWMRFWSCFGWGCRNAVIGHPFQFTTVEFSMRSTIR